eukprot:4973516-Alexandrium_andersonii.AAC.1
MPLAQAAARAGALQFSPKPIGSPSSGPSTGTARKASSSWPTSRAWAPAARSSPRSRSSTAARPPSPWPFGPPSAVSSKLAAARR